MAVILPFRLPIRLPRPRVILTVPMVTLIALAAALLIWWDLYSITIN